MMKAMAFLTLFLSLPSFAYHLLLPDLITLKNPLYDNVIDTWTFPGRVLLRFSNGTANIGRGRLEVRGGSIVNGKKQVYQRIYKKNGGHITRYAGSSVYHPEHGHTHFEDYADYRLREVDPSGGVGAIVAQSEKVSFCLYDEYIYNSRLPNFSRYPRYRSCGSSYQGLSVGWKDVYGKELAGQWIDITDVPNGEYWLESEVDPLNRIRESNGSNNKTRIRITID